MRTASEYQQSPTANPKLTVVVGIDTYTSEGAGGSERLLRAFTDEQPWGGQYIVELDNSDEALNAKSYEGEGVTLTMTFIGETAGSFPPLWVHSQQFISREGRLLLQLNCIDIWGLIAAHNVTLANASYNQQWQQESELSVRYLPDGTTLLSTGEPTLYATLLANGDMTIWAIIQDLATALGVTITKDDDDGYVDSLKPPLSFGNARSGLRQIMDMTKSYLKYKTNGNLGVYQPDLHATVHSFNTLNLFYSNVEEAGLTIPNRVTFWAFHPDGDEWISGTDTDAESYGKIGKYIDRHYLVATFDTENRRSVVELEALAAGALEKIQAERNQGLFVAPNHVALELFDKVEVVDSRYDTPRTTTGYVHRLIREYDRGVYRITVYLGGVGGGYTVPGGADSKGLADAEPPEAPTTFPEAGLTIGAYIADVAFTSVDWDTVSWGAGLVTLADGRSQAVDSGSYDFVAGGAHYFYVILGNSTMQVSTTATDAVDDDRMLVAVGARGSSSAVKAYILNPYTDDILINTDKVMDGLVTELKLANEAVTNAKIAVNAIQGDVIAASAITETKIASDSISTPKLQTGSITTSKIGAGEVTTAKLDALAVTAEKIAASAVTADKINAGAVTAVKIDVATLSAISANCGTLTAGTINGVIAYFGGGSVYCYSGGIRIDGAKLTLRDSGGSHSGELYIDTSGRLRLDDSAWNGGVLADFLEANFGIHSGTYLECETGLWLGEYTSAPSANDGRIVFNPNTGYINVYSSAYGNWWHVNRDAGWA